MSDVAEQFTEWAVSWDGGFYAPHPDPFPVTEAGVREFAKGIAPIDNPVVVFRTVTRTEWRPADGKEES